LSKLILLFLLTFSFSTNGTILHLNKDNNESSLKSEIAKSENVTVDIVDVIQDTEKGKITVISSPESGMAIFLNNVNTGKTTPTTLENLPFGNHNIRLVNQWYRTQEKTVHISSNEIQTVSFEMIASFSELTVNTSLNGIIFIDGDLKGSTKWKGRVGEGTRTVKVEKEGFITRELKVTIVRGRDVSVDLMLTPKTGILEVITDPPQAMISLNGNIHGLSPRIITDLPLGRYELKIEKAEHTSLIMHVNINDASKQVVEVQLQSGKEIFIQSNPSGAEVIIDQKSLGTTPITTWLKYGNHLIKLVKDELAVVQSINVTQAGRKEFTIDLKSSNDPFEGQMVLVKGGSFRMGDTFGDGNREEKPAHPVTVSDFYIGKYEVTQQQWKMIMGNNPSHFAGCDNCPVERVSWLEVQEFLAKLNDLTGQNYRLPTEAEWEYAAKGGAESKGFKYSGRSNVNFVSWFSGNSGNKTNPVGTKEPNELGLYDMSGNVWEWVNDWFGAYTDFPKDNPKGPDNGDFRIVRGGSWFGYIGGSRVSCRGSDDPSNKRSYIGFRIVRTPQNN
jgi:formylglycine-generating enzyme required for sulfatase activity